MYISISCKERKAGGSTIGNVIGKPYKFISHPVAIAGSLVQLCASNRLTPRATGARLFLQLLQICCP